MSNKVLKIQEFLNVGEAALVTSDENRFYLTGFPSSAGTVLITKQNAYFLIDFRYFEKAKKTVTSCEVILAEKGGTSVLDLLGKENIKKLYVETNKTSVAVFKSMKEKYGEVLTESDEFDKYITRCREIKDEKELALIREAQKLTDDTFSYILERIEAGRTEKDVMLDMEFYMRKLGSEGVSFDFIVVSGKNSSLPHGVPTDKVIEKGDFLTMDFGAIVGGYHSDMTRTVAVGHVTEEMERVYNTVAAAQDAAFEVIKPGVVCMDVDKASRDLIYGAGYEGCFGHGLGHGVGVEIHEAPSFNFVCETKLEKGMVMTVEPGIYLEDKFGVRIEDMVFITDDGYENITKSDKKLIIL